MSLREIAIAYGADGYLTCALPAENVVLHHAAPPAVVRLADRVRDCLNSPLEFPALAQAVLPEDQVLIALDTQTPCAETLIRGCWDVLAARGVHPQHTVILQPDDAASQDPRSKLPSEVRRQVRLIRHDPADASKRAYLATSTSGERIYLAREIVEADFVLCMGTIAYDPLLGCRGTNSVLYPGLSSAEAIRKCRGHGHDELGSHDSRPLRQTVDEIGWLLGMQFALQVVPAARENVAAVLAGTSDAVLRRGRQLLSKFWTIEVDERAQLVVVAVDAIDERAAWSAIGAALETARRLVVRNGHILLLSQANARLSPGLEMLRESRTPREVLQPLRLATPDDFVAATQIAHATDWAHVSVLSSFEDDLIGDLFMTPLRQVDDCLNILRLGERIVIIDSAECACGQIRIPDAIEETTES